MTAFHSAAVSNSVVRCPIPGLGMADKFPVFANLYYEFNNYMVDSNNVQSNLKCALYGDIHNATEKTNLGGQQLLPPPAGLTYITNSTGWAAKTLAEPAVPEGYELVFGPIDGANNSPGVSRYSILDYGPES